MKNDNLRRWTKALGALVIVVFLSACGEAYLQSTINPVTDYGEVSHNLYVQVFWWTMIILAVVWALMAYILIRFREKPGQEKPEQIHGHMGLEIAWTIVGRPVSLRLESGDVIHSFWVPRLGGKRDVNPVSRVPQGEEAHRNWMHFTIKEEGVFWGQCAEFCGEAHSLMGIRVVAESEADFQQWVTDWLTTAPTANAPEVVTADASAAMAGPPAAGAFVAMGAPNAPDPQEGDPAAGRPVSEDPLLTAGREAFMTRCVQCHAVQGTPAPGILGPNLTRIGSRTTIAAGMLENTEENLIRWITDPSAVKPGAQMPGVADGVTYEGLSFPPTALTEEQIRAVAAYLSSMK
jgi:cytochrome c oxidase subunit 2